MVDNSSFIADDRLFLSLGLRKPSEMKPLGASLFTGEPSAQPAQRHG